jgi:hypothetical protein
MASPHGSWPWLFTPLTIELQSVRWWSRSSVSFICRKDANNDNKEAKSRQAFDNGGLIVF